MNKKKIRKVIKHRHLTKIKNDQIFCCTRRK